jgi:hypothetical protein
MIPIEVVIDRPGSTPLRLTPSQRSLHWSTAAVGGFGGASFELPGDVGRWKREIPLGGLVRIVLDTFVIWEGQIEDITIKPADGTASVSCFGLRRKLEEVSVRRIWTQRTLTDWDSRTAYFAGVTNHVGQFDQADLTRSGPYFDGATVAVVSGNVAVQHTNAPDGMTWTRALGTYWEAGNTGNFNGQVRSSSDGVGFTVHASPATLGTTFDVALVANARVFEVGMEFTANYTPPATDRAAFYNLRLLGTSLTEYATGGFYGGSILRDLVALVPGLKLGNIESGSDFTIEAIERAVRSSSLAVVEEVASYYTREWAVWEDGRFDWDTVNRDEPQWMVRVADLQSGSEITSSVDGLAKTVYISYPNAALQRDSETSSISADQRNPYVKQGKTKDLLVSPGFPMTPSTSGQLASKIAGDTGTYPPVQGRLVLPAMLPIKRANGPTLPAFQIRGGENILVSDLPKTDLFSSGRDGESLFHIVSTEADLDSGLVTLILEGQTRRSDVLLARLAEATRVFTGG